MSTRVKRKRSGSFEDNPEANQGKDPDKWNEELHRCFVEAIYDAGVSQSSPSVIMENMSERPASLTSERVKSHLQKYRKNKQKSKEDFMQDYDTFMRKAMTVGGAGGGTSHAIMPPSAVIEMMGGLRPSGGETAAFLTYSVMTEGEEVKSNAPGKTISSASIAKDSQDYLKNFVGTHISFPQLTEEEKRSPLGISMVYVMGLFASLSQHTMHQRRKKLKTVGGEGSNGMPSDGTNSASLAPAVTTKITDVTPDTFSSRAKKQPQDNGHRGLQYPSNGDDRAPATISRRFVFASAGNFPAMDPGPPPNMGLFHPVLAKPELLEARNGSTNNWNSSIYPTPVPIFDELPPKLSYRNGSPNSPKPEGGAHARI